MDVFLKNSGYSEITGSLVISGSLTVNGVGISGSTSTVGLITTGSISSTQSITGSLNIVNDMVVSGSFINNPIVFNISGTGSIDLNSGSFWVINLPQNPTNHHLEFINMKNGQNVFLLLINGTNSKNVTTNGYYTNLSTTPNLGNNTNSIFNGVCYNNVTYLNVSRR